MRPWKAPLAGDNPYMNPYMKLIPRQGGGSVVPQGWTPPDYKSMFTPDMEKEFQTWNAEQSRNLGLNPNPDDPQHFYDLRGAWLSGIRDTTGHLTDKYKLPGHPTFSTQSIYYKPGMKAIDLESRQGGGPVTPPEEENPYLKMIKNIGTPPSTPTPFTPGPELEKPTVPTLEERTKLDLTPSPKESLMKDLQDVGKQTFPVPLGAIMKATGITDRLANPRQHRIEELESGKVPAAPGELEHEKFLNKYLGTIGKIISPLFPAEQTIKGAAVGTIQPVYHGGPFPITQKGLTEEAFTKMVGKGEGGGAAGYGFYTSDVPNVAETYLQPTILGRRAKDVAMDRTGAVPEDIKTIAWHVASFKDPKMARGMMELNLDPRYARLFDELVKKGDIEFGHLHEMSLFKGKNPSEYNLLRLDQPIPRDQRIQVLFRAQQEGWTPEEMGKLGIGAGKTSELHGRISELKEELKSIDESINTKSKVEMEAWKAGTNKPLLAELDALHNQRNKIVNEISNAARSLKGQDTSGAELYNKIADILSNRLLKKLPSSDVVSTLGKRLDLQQEAQKATSEFLYRASIRGNQYPTGWFGGSGDPTKSNSRYNKLDKGRGA